MLRLADRENSLEIVAVSVQSGSKLELRHDVEATEEMPPQTGTFLLNLVLRYNGWFVSIGRTILFSASEVAREANEMLPAIKQLIIDMLRPGSLFKDIYNAAAVHVTKAKPSLLPTFTEDVGFLSGFEFQNGEARICGSSDRIVEADDVFIIPFGFLGNSWNPKP